MGKIHLKTYQWVLRAVVELLDLFPPRRIEREEFTLRKGMLPDGYQPPKDGTIWVHGASLGEFITLKPFLENLSAIYGKQHIVCTSTTMDGLRQLQKDELCGLATLLPIELPAFTIPFIEKIKPRAMLISETEIWPLMLATLARKKVPYGIINGRINEQSVRFMRIAWPLFYEAINNLSFVCAQEKLYQKRFKILGVSPEKISITGCFKYDFIDTRVNEKETRKRFSIPENRNLICFGSTHPGEEEIILDALEPLWSQIEATAIIAPRHVKRTNELTDLLRKRNLDFSLASKPGKAARHVILVDTLGELKNFYAISNLAFVGGSLVKKGGHNLLEPATYEVPVITGPETFNFRYEVRNLKKADALKIVNSKEDLQSVITDWAQNPELYNKMGKRGRKVLEQMSGAGQRTIDLLRKMEILP